jgi:hypothetical protein
MTRCVTWSPAGSPNAPPLSRLIAQLDGLENNGRRPNPAACSRLIENVSTHLAADTNDYHDKAMEAAFQTLDELRYGFMESTPSDTPIATHLNNMRRSDKFICSYPSARRWLRRFRHYYNRYRPNQALDGRTPAQEVLN